MSTTNHPVVVVDILGEVITAMSVNNPVTNTDFTINYEPGRSIQIISSISAIDNSTSMKGLKYPLIAVLLPIREDRTNDFYAKVKIDRIVIAVLTESNTGSEFVLDKYKSTANFKTVLYPLYYEFFKQLARHHSVVNKDPDNFNHIKIDNPGWGKISEDSNDFIDSIEIQNLEFFLNQLKTC